MISILMFEGPHSPNALKQQFRLTESGRSKEVCLYDFAIVCLILEFFLERSNAKNAYAIRYREGKNDYYLCVESAGKLVLRVS